jgi:hypothetical protein
MYECRFSLHTRHYVIQTVIYNNQTVSGYFLQSIALQKRF